MDDRVFSYKQERYRDLLREAELFRLVHPGRDGCSESRQFYHRALTGFARNLIKWEARLRKRHDEAPVFPAWALEIADNPCP